MTATTIDDTTERALGQLVKRWAAPFIFGALFAGGAGVGGFSLARGTDQDGARAAVPPSAYATKEDVAKVKDDCQRDVQAVREAVVRIETAAGATKEAVGDLKTEFRGMTDKLDRALRGRGR